MHYRQDYSVLRAGLFSFAMFSVAEERVGHGPEADYA